jgi:AbrB family looped-hinge helix DNA binding protein
MAASTSRVTTQNQISVPAAVRRRFDIRPGTVLEWHEVEGELMVRPRRVTLDQVRTELRTMVTSRKRTLSELKEARVAATLAKHRRARR